MIIDFITMALIQIISCQRFIVKVEEQRTSGDNPVYFHTLTEKGHRLLDMLLKRIGQPKLIRQTKELIKELTEIPSDDLERMDRYTIFSVGLQNLAPSNLLGNSAPVSPISLSSK